MQFMQKLGGTKVQAEQAVETMIETIVSFSQEGRRSFNRRPWHLLSKAAKGSQGSQPSHWRNG
jgi:hypothetical protein